MTFELRMGGWRVGKRLMVCEKKGQVEKLIMFFQATIEAWIERLTELSQEYEPQNILNLDELGLFFKTLPEKGLAEKKSKD